MPSRNIVKTYIENGCYHIYNRGVEKRQIFLDETDCRVFFHYLKLYLSPVNEIELLQLQMPKLRIQRFIPLNLYAEIDLFAIALMPNHFHLLMQQSTREAIIKLMQRVTTAYTMYFNKKYKRIGSLFQGTYKAILVESDNYLLHLSRYIHLNSKQINTDLINFNNFSSYPYYLGHRQASWIKPEKILSFFKSTMRTDFKNFLSYQSFVEDYQIDPIEILEDLTLEND